MSSGGGTDQNQNADIADKNLRYKNRGARSGFGKDATNYVNSAYDSTGMKEDYFASDFFTEFSGQEIDLTEQQKQFIASRGSAFADSVKAKNAELAEKALKLNTDRMSSQAAKASRAVPMAVQSKAGVSSNVDSQLKASLLGLNQEDFLGL